MSKKKQQMSRVELLDAFFSIFGGCWVLALGYIAFFAESSLLAFLTVVPVFFIYSLYLLGSAIYVVKEVEILEALGKDTWQAKAARRKKEPKLNKTKLIAAGIIFVCGILLCILL